MAKVAVTCTGAMEGVDGRPTVLSGPNGEPVYRTCGRTFDAFIANGDPSDPQAWDVKESEDGRVLSRHKQVTCPFCGAGTFVVEA